MSDLIERLRRTEVGQSSFGGVRAGAFHSMLVNPDGPKAADYITTLEAKLAVAREALEKVAACETSINGRIAREALSAMIAASTPHDDGGE